MKVTIYLCFVLFLLFTFKELEEEKILTPLSGPFLDKVNTSKGYLLNGCALDSASKYTKAVGTSSVLLVEVDTIKKTSTIYSIYVIPHNEKKKSLTIR